MIMIGIVLARTSVRNGSQLRSLTHCLSALSIKDANPCANPPSIHHQTVRPSTTSFFNKLPAQEIWKGVTSVSNAGKKRGRGSMGRKKFAKNLNRGQIIGVGKENMVWPGLNSPVVRGKEIVERHKLPEDPEREAKLIKIRSQMGFFRPLKLSPIERGWSGGKQGGRKLGPPDPVGEDTFDGFDSRVLEYKTVTHMTGNMGRKRTVSAMVVTGNKQGLAGFALGRAVEGKSALTTAKNRAGQKLMFIERYNNHTVYHDFYTQYNRTKIFVKKKQEGYGLVGHRIIKTICEVVGIKDLHAKIEGSTTPQHIVKAFFLGLLQQKTHEQLSEETGLHLVEFREENFNAPTVVASPYECNENIQDIPDFDQYVMNNRVVLEKKKWPPFYAEYEGHKRYLWVTEKQRTHHKIRLELMSRFGAVRSHMADEHPECDADYAMRKWLQKRAAKGEQ